MNRRAFIGSLTGGLLAAPLTAGTQQIGKAPRIGFLSPGSPSDAGRSPSNLAVLFAAFREGLRELGYVEGQNIEIESRWAEGNYDRLPGLAADLVRLKVAVILTYGTPASQAAKRATATIPIVMAAIIDPLASGLVTSLARPGENLTGQSMMSPDLVEKQLGSSRRSSLRFLGWPSSIIRPTQAMRHRCDTRRMRPGPWACGFNSWAREVPARSTAPLRR